MRLVMGMVVGVLVSGCGVDCMSRTASAGPGFHGCVVSVDDVGAVNESPISGFQVEIFADEPPLTPGDGLAPLASARTDGSGFYELSVASGTWWVCSGSRVCVQATVPNGASVALDYTSSVSPTRWHLRE